MLSSFKNAVLRDSLIRGCSKHLSRHLLCRIRKMPRHLASSVCLTYDEMQLVGKVRCKEWLNAEPRVDSSNLQSHITGVSKVTFRGLRASRFVCLCQALRSIIIMYVAIKTVKFLIAVPRGRIFQPRIWINSVEPALARQPQLVPLRGKPRA